MHSLPDVVLSRVFFLHATTLDAQRGDPAYLSNPAPPFCCGELEADLCPELALEPDVMPERLAPLRAVCRRFRRLIDADPYLRERVLLNCVPDSKELEGKPLVCRDDFRSDEDLGEARWHEPGAGVSWLLQRPESFKRGVRRLRVVLDRFPALCAAQLRALGSDAVLAESVEELDLLFLRLEAQHHRMCCASLVPRFPNLRVLRIASHVHAVEGMVEPLRLRGGARAKQTARKSTGGKAPRRPLWNDEVTEPAAWAIASLGRLEVLDIPGLPMAVGGIRAMGALPLRALHLSSFPPWASDRSERLVEAAARAFPKLQRLRYHGSSRGGPARCIADDEDGADYLALDEALARLADLRSLGMKLCLHSLKFLRHLPRLEHFSAVLDARADLAPLAKLGPRLRTLGALRSEAELLVRGLVRGSNDDSDGSESDSSAAEAEREARARLRAAASRAALVSTLEGMHALEGLHLWATEGTLLALAEGPFSSLPRLRLLSLFCANGPTVPLPLITRTAAGMAALQDLRVDALLLPLPEEAAAALAGRRLRRLRATLFPSLELLDEDEGGDGPEPPEGARRRLRATLLPSLELLDEDGGGDGPPARRCREERGRLEARLGVRVSPHPACKRGADVGSRWMYLPRAPSRSDEKLTRFLDAM
eukprot:tig00021318_g20181.t1